MTDHGTGAQFEKLLQGSSLGDAALYVDCDVHGNQPLDPFTEECIECESNMARATGDACRRCGCTDEEACAGGCFWVEPGLCSACAVTLVEQCAVVGAALRSLGRLLLLTFEEWVRRRES